MVLRLILAWFRFLMPAFKDSPSPPKAPAPIDPSVQISAEARARPSVFSPYGTSVYSGDPNVTGSFRQDITLSPEQQRQFQGRNQVAEALLGRSNKALAGLPVGYEFTGAENPTTNRFFMNQKKMLDEAFNDDEERLHQRLANQGLPTGSEAYNEELDRFQRGRSDALEKASADALQLGFGQDIATRQQNLNEIAQALGGSQLTPVGQAPGIDTSGAFANQQAAQNRQYQGQVAGYNADVASQNSMTGGLFGLGAAAVPLIFSDRRLKRDILRVGELEPGIGWYSYHYNWDAKDAPLRYGVMADEVEAVNPEAVIYNENGFAMVDFGRLFAGRTLQ